MVSWKGLLDVENKGYVLSLSSVWAGLSSSLPLRILSSSYICPQVTGAQPRAHLSHASVARAGKWAGPGSSPAPVQLLRRAPGSWAPFPPFHLPPRVMGRTHSRSRSSVDTEPAFIIGTTPSPKAGIEPHTCMPMAPGAESMIAYCRFQHDHLGNT